MNKVLVVVDMQNDFVTGSLGTAEAKAIVPLVTKKVAEEIAAGTTVVFTQDTHGDDYLKTREGVLLPVPHCIKGTPGWEIIPELQPYAAGKRIFCKQTFGSLDLMTYIKEQQFLVIEVLGLCTDICVISNALLLKAALPEAEIVVDGRYSAGVTTRSHKNALAALKMCQVTVLNDETDETA